MTARFQQTESVKSGVRRRATSKGLSFGPIATAITVGVVALLIGVTFVGDWLRTPELMVEASPSIISPNDDRTQEATNFGYTLNEDATVTVEVFNEGDSLVRTITNEEFQTRGQHITIWDGMDDRGQIVTDGRYRLQVEAQGTVRSTAQGVNVLVDTQPPMLHVANLEDTTRVREPNLTIEGLTEPDSVVQVQGDPTLIPVDADGKFSIKRQLREGSNNIEIMATDPAGNTTILSREVDLVTNPPEIAMDTPQNDLWTNENIITVAGQVPAGASLRVNGQEAEVGPEGNFEREVILQEGDNTLRIEATDDVGNTATQEIILHRKTTAPTLDINVEEGNTYQQSEVQIIGKTEPGATVTIGGQQVAVSPVGEFQTTVSLMKGENLVEVMAQDQAGNVTELQRVMRFEVAPPETELARVARNLPSLSNYFVPVLLALPILLLAAYFVTRPVSLVVSAESSSFRPGLPEEGRFLQLAIDLSKPARTTVEIKNSQGQTVATLLHRRHRGAGQKPLYWDGYDDFGKVVPPGEYVVHATASTTGGTVRGTLNISIVEDLAVHRQYIRTTPHQSDVVKQQNNNYMRPATSTSRRARRR